MSRTIDVLVPGIPVPQPRPKAQLVKRRGREPFAHIYTPEGKTGGGITGWKQVVGLYLRSALPDTPWDGPILIQLVFYLERPDYLLKASSPAGVLRCDKKPDIDNLAKAVLDVMTDVELIRDDGRVSDLVIRKRYAAKGRGPGVRIVAELLDPQEVLL